MPHTPLSESSAADDYAEPPPSELNLAVPSHLSQTDHSGRNVGIGIALNIHTVAPDLEFLNCASSIECSSSNIRIFECERSGSRPSTYDPAKESQRLSLFSLLATSGKMFLLNLDATLPMGTDPSTPGQPKMFLD
ncbi:hypothetical protein OPQ81_008800 [Rhizoctonia solani]|nr:hypothetical protein OPQ81_008800 [Rhizoctonia solani]